LKTAVILHGTEGSSQSSWLPWLKAHLEEQGVEVWVPDLPKPEYPSLQEWSDFVINDCPFVIDDSTALIGHSAGAVAVLIVAQKLTVEVERIVSVAAFKSMDHLDFPANDRIFDVEFDFEKIKQNCKNILFVHSDNDPYCPLDHAEYLAEKTAGKLEIIPGQEHFNLEASPKYSRFPEVLSCLGVSSVLTRRINAPHKDR
jgi:predicted alpha/beta hydrolase family esterase